MYEYDHGEDELIEKEERQARPFWEKVKNFLTAIVFGLAFVVLILVGIIVLIVLWLK